MKKEDLDDLIISPDLIDEKTFTKEIQLKKAEGYQSFESENNKSEFAVNELLNLKSIKFMYSILSLNKYGETNKIVLDEMRLNRLNNIGQALINNIPAAEYLNLSSKNLDQNDLISFIDRNKKLFSDLIKEDLNKLPSELKLVYVHLLSGSLLKNENNIAFEKHHVFFKTLKHVMNDVLNKIEQDRPFLLVDNTHTAFQFILDNLLYPNINESKTNVREETIKNNKLIDNILNYKEQFKTDKEKNDYISFFIENFLEKLDTRYKIKDKYYTQEEIKVLERSTLYLLIQLVNDNHTKKLSIYENETLFNAIVNINFSNDDKTNTDIKNTLGKFVDENEHFSVEKIDVLFEKIHNKAKKIDELPKDNNSNSYADLFSIILLMTRNIALNGNAEEIETFFKNFPLDLGQELCQMLMVDNKNLSDTMLNNICFNCIVAKENMLQTNISEHIKHALNQLSKNQIYIEKNGAEISKNFFEMINFLTEQETKTIINNEKRMEIFELFIQSFKDEIKQGYYKKYSPLTYLISQAKENVGLVPYVIKFINEFPEIINQKDKNDKTALDYIKEKNTELKVIKDELLYHGALPKLSSFKKLLSYLSQILMHHKKNDYEYIGSKKEIKKEAEYKDYYNLSNDFNQKINANLTPNEIKNFQQKINSIIEKIEKIIPQMENKEGFIADDNYLFFKSLKESHLVNFTNDFCKSINQIKDIDAQEKNKSQTLLKQEFSEQLKLIEDKIEESFTLYSSILAEKNVSDLAKNTLFLKSKV